MKKLLARRRQVRFSVIASSDGIGPEKLLFFMQENSENLNQLGEKCLTELIVGTVNVAKVFQKGKIFRKWTFKGIVVKSNQVQL